VTICDFFLHAQLCALFFVAAGSPESVRKGCGQQHSEPLIAGLHRGMGTKKSEGQ